jgi:hypothetical protein
MVELDEKAVEAAVRAYSETLRHNHEVGPILQDRRNKAVIAAIMAYLSTSSPLSTARSEGAREATERAAKVADGFADAWDLEAADYRSVAAAIRAQGETG